MAEKTYDINIDRMATFIDHHLDDKTYDGAHVPPFSSIEFSNNAMCNRRCIFCPRVDKEAFPNKNEHLSFDMFKRVMDDLASVSYTGRISFSGFVEPLLTRDLEEYIRYGKNSCPQMTIEITSNGDHLTLERLKSLFAAGLNFIKLSLYDGPHQDEKFIQMTKEAGLTDRHVLLRPRYLPPEKSYGLTISNRAGAAKLQNESITLKPLDEPLQQPCFYPFYKMMVDYNGDVLICSNDWMKKLVVGNLNHHSVFEVWNSKPFNEVRQRLMKSDRSAPPCNVCDVNGILNGEKHFKAWTRYFKNGA